MRKASRITTQLYDKKLKPLKIKITQFSILSLLASGEYETVNSLSEALLMDRTTLSRSLDILYKYKLIENLKSNDARKRMVKLTSKGFEVLEQAIPLWKEAEDEVFDESKKYGFSAL
jgi:DNA-binding MarR family transcriptional regulator|tara:strand:- start:449 stop:799 length:351 start_codon:yes stop_codon:yes gene_type:complete